MVAAREAGRTLGSVTGCGARAKCFLNEQAVAVFNSSSRKCVFCSLVFFSSANRAAWPEPPGLSTAGRFGPGPPRMWRRRLEREWGRREGTASKRATLQAWPGPVSPGAALAPGPMGRGRRVLCPVGPKQTAVGARATGASRGQRAAGGVTQAGAAATGGGTWPPPRDGAASAARGETPRRPRRPARCSAQGHGVCFRVTSADSSVGRSGAKAPCTGDSVPL